LLSHGTLPGASARFADPSETSPRKTNEIP
jgi:hypothetical protein